MKMFHFKKLKVMQISLLLEAGIVTFESIISHPQKRRIRQIWVTYFFLGSVASIFNRAFFSEASFFILIFLAKFSAVTDKMPKIQENVPVLRDFAIYPFEILLWGSISKIFLIVGSKFLLPGGGGGFLWWFN